MKNLTWQNPEQLFVAQELINKVKSKCCGIKVKYNSQGDLIADNTYYSQRQMLYQIITRTRKKLHIVIIDNEVMLDRCIDILNK